MKMGYLGVGKMGLPMAGKLLDGGHELWVHDIRDDAMTPLLERQARRAISPKALADECDTIVVSLPTLDAFRAAMSGADGFLDGDAIETLINTCTVGGKFTKEVEAACTERGVVLIDAPISGGVAGAEAGTLTTMVSGDRDRIRALMPIFELWGPNVVNAGSEAGAAQTMKLANNILFAVGLIATSEAMTMASKGGIDAEAMIEVMNSSTGRNFSTMMLFPNAVLPRSFAFGATLDLLMKDVDLAIEQGEEVGVPMWVCQAARLVLKHGIYQGRGDQDLSRAIEIIEEGTEK